MAASSKTLGSLSKGDILGTFTTTKPVAKPKPTPTASTTAKAPKVVSSNPVASNPGLVSKNSYYIPSQGTGEFPNNGEVRPPWKIITPQPKPTYVPIGKPPASPPVSNPQIGPPWSWEDRETKAPPLPPVSNTPPIASPPRGAPVPPPAAPATPPPDMTELANVMALMMPSQSQSITIGGEDGQPLPSQVDRGFRGKDPNISNRADGRLLDLLRGGFWG